MISTLRENQESIFFFENSIIFLKRCKKRWKITIGNHGSALSENSTLLPAQLNILWF